MTDPSSFDALRGEISARHAALSRQLQKIARFALANPNDMALETVAAIARRAEVQPSSLIRFAKAFGYEGFSDMQRVFRGRLVDRAPSYRERIRGTAQRVDAAPDGAGVLGHFVDAGVHALAHLRQEVRPEQIERALGLIAGASTVYLIGQRRSFPVAAYLAYALGHLERRVDLIDGLGGMTLDLARTLDPAGVLVAVSFSPYAAETLAVAEQARARGLAVVAITDGPLSPLGPLAAVTFEIEDAEVDGFRSLSATMCLAVSLVVGLGQHLVRGDGARPPAARARRRGRSAG